MENKILFKKTIRKIIFIFLVSVLTNYLLYILNEVSFFSIYNARRIDADAVKRMEINLSSDSISNYADTINASCGELITTLMICNNYRIDEKSIHSLNSRRFILLRNKIMKFNPTDFKFYSNIYSSLINDMKYFPVPHSEKDTPWVEYVNSWGNERTYGGERTHEGTDVMAKINMPGIYPVVSVCDGTITNIGWLELGGYRIGITSPNGIYYYYAHLDSYNDNLKEGDKIMAGQLLGFMGNTGYSKVEGTKGKFDVHLHFGIYIESLEGNEMAVNPYFLLKNLENKVLYYNY